MDTDELTNRQRYFVTLPYLLNTIPANDLIYLYEGSQGRLHVVYRCAFKFPHEMKKLVRQVSPDYVFDETYYSYISVTSVMYERDDQDADVNMVVYRVSECVVSKQTEHYAKEVASLPDNFLLG